MGSVLMMGNNYFVAGIVVSRQLNGGKCVVLRRYSGEECVVCGN